MVVSIINVRNNIIIFIRIDKIIIRLKDKIIDKDDNDQNISLDEL
jgi:hypothetical protein